MPPPSARRPPPRTSIAQGQFLNAAIGREPVCVLGAAAAQLLGIDKIFLGERVWVTGTNVNGNGGMWLYVAGILNPDVLSPDVDSSVLVGLPFAETFLSFNGGRTWLRSAGVVATFATSRTFTLILSPWAAASGADLTGKTATLRG
jgi:hypothetical protein